MHYGVKGKELREESPPGIGLVKQWRHILEERRRKERKGQATELGKQESDGREENSARTEMRWRRSSLKEGQEVVLIANWQQ